MMIWDCLDYREWLKALYNQAKQRNPHFSYRLIAKKAGFSSAGYFTKILHGKANISLEMSRGLAEAFKLKKYEIEYFEVLVQFNQAKTPELKKTYFGKLRALRKSKLKTIESSQYEYFLEWYYPAIREILGFYRFKGNYEELARCLVPAISVKEAKKAVEILVSLGYVVKTAQGLYQRTDAALSTGDNWQSQAITQYQFGILNLAKHAYDIWPKDQRECSTLTLTLSETAFQKCKDKLAQYRREMLELADTEPGADRVYQFIFQGFPLNRITEAS